MSQTGKVILGQTINTYACAKGKPLVKSLLCDASPRFTLARFEGESATASTWLYRRDPPNWQMVPPRPGPEGTAGCYTFKLKDADVTCRKPASQEIRQPYEELDSI